MRVIRSSILLLLVLNLGCSKQENHSAPASARSVTDFRGKNIVLKRPANRIVCLLESALSGLYMLKAESAIIGLPASVYRQPIFGAYASLDPRLQTKSIAAPGNWDFVNIESVIALQPDLVIIWSDQRDAIALLEDHDIPVYAVMLNNFSDVFKEISDLGVLTGTSSRADSLVQFTRNEMHILNQKTSSAQHTPGVYFMWPQGPLETSGMQSTVQELLILGGARNVCAGSQEHLVVHMEDVLRWNPELIVQWNNPRLTPQDLLLIDGWKELKAVKENRVYQLPSPFLCDFWTLKFIIAAYYVSAWCNPTGISNGMIEKEQQRILEYLYGKRGVVLN